MDSVHGTRDVARQVQYLLDVDRLIKFFIYHTRFENVI